MESAGRSGGHAETLAGKAKNAKRREAMLSAFVGNSFVPAARCGRV